MGTNKTVEVVETPFGSKLRIKTKDRRLSDKQREQLIRSLELAQNVLFIASASLLRASQPTTFERSVFAAHFRMGNDLKAQDRLLVRSNFSNLRRALVSDLTIADSSSSDFTHELRNAAYRAAQELQELEEEALERELARDRRGEPFDPEYRSPAEKWWDQEKKDERAKHAVAYARAQSQRATGFVKPHKPFAALRTGKDRPDAVPMKSDQYGSIHINFQTLLTGRNDMKVAITIIHEGSHKFLDTLDFAYIYETKYKTMTAEEAFRKRRQLCICRGIAIPRPTDASRS